MQYLFNTSFGVKLNPDQVVETIVDFMRDDNKRRYKITIGTDSERLSGDFADFVTAIVVHRVGNGGRYFWRRIASTDKESGTVTHKRIFYSLRERILEEVLISLEIAKTILAKLKAAASQSADVPDFDFEIHVDIGENGETKAMIQELVGMVRANNFEAKTKPESYAATTVADRHV